MRIEREYQILNGKLTVKLETTCNSQSDRDNILHEIATKSHNFYLQCASEINSTLLKSQDSFDSNHNR